jgi:Fic family protein
MNYTPPFKISTKAISMIAEISALIERYAIRMEQQDVLRLRKANKIKTIQSSLAIEGNTLTENQVKDILNGKKVVAPLREIQEVKNAIATYELASKLNPFSANDLLKAHEVMMSALVEEAGKFRQGGVGVFVGKQIVHMAPPAGRVPALIADLFNWLKKAEDHLLIRSCVFHYEFEFIHPFANGNGRMGRLWQSLILARLHPVFQYLPIESMVHDKQQEYYEAINASTANTNSGIFIDFMLNEILQTLKMYQGTALEAGGGVNGALIGGVNEVLAFIKKSPGCRANGIASVLNTPLRSVQRYLSQLKDENKIEFRGAPRNGGYYPIGDK